MDEQLLHFFSGDLDDEQRVKLLTRVETEAAMRDDFIHLQNLNALTQLTFRTFDEDEGHQGYQELSTRIKKNHRKKTLTNFSKIAAIFLLIFVSVLWVTLQITSIASKQNMNVLRVPAGQRAQIILQDGTEVWLNAQSTLKYPAYFYGKNRKVEITGEAYFNVAKDKKRPFIVEAGQVMMEVLGTQFNVYCYSGADYFQTNLEEGSLKVYTTNDKNKEIILKPNEQVIIRENEMFLSETENPDHTLWKEGIYAFNNAPLINILEQLQLYYDVKIIVKDPEIFNVRYTGKFRQRDGIDEILRILQKIQAFKIEKDKENNIITLTK